MEKYLTVAELAKVLKCSRSLAYTLVKKPGFPVARLGKKVVIPETALAEWISNGGTEQKGA